MKMFCKDLKEQAMKIINYEKKEMIALTDKEERVLWKSGNLLYMWKGIFYRRK